MLTPERQHELCELLDALYEGTLDEAGAGRLSEVVSSNEEALRLYLGYLHTHGLLHLRFADSDAASPRFRPRKSWILHGLIASRWPIAAAVAAGVVLALTSWHLLRPARTELIVASGRLEKQTATDAWAEATSIVSGDHIRVIGDVDCVLRLDAPGQLTLAPGMTGVLQYPERGERLRFEVARGRASFDLGASSQGYQIVTPAGNVRVLGTKFTVDVQDHGEASLDVWVQAGKVQVENEIGRIVLQDGQALRCTSRSDPARARLTVGDIVFVQYQRHPGLAMGVVIDDIDARGIRFHVPHHDEQRVPFERVNVVRPLEGVDVEVNLKRDGHFHPASVTGVHGRSIEIRAGNHNHRVTPDQLRIKLAEH